MDIFHSEIDDFGNTINLIQIPISVMQNKFPTKVVDAITIIPIKCAIPILVLSYIIISWSLKFNFDNKSVIISCILMLFIFFVTDHFRLRFYKIIFHC